MTDERAPILNRVQWVTDTMVAECRAPGGGTKKL
jgi:hypothetical protein